MANVALGGFRWRKNRRGGANQEPREERMVASNNTTAIFAGDPVKLVNDGTVVVAAAGDAVYGICMGATRYRNSSGTIRGGNFLPAGTTYTGAPVMSNDQASVIQCCPVVGQIFEVDVNTGQASLTAAQTLVHNNANSVANAGNTSSGRSAYVLDASTAAVTAALQWRILEIAPDPSNDPTSANWKVLVEANVGTEPSATTATGT